MNLNFIEKGAISMNNVYGINHPFCKEVVIECSSSVDVSDNNFLYTKFKFFNNTNKQLLGIIELLHIASNFNLYKNTNTIDVLTEVFDNSFYSELKSVIPVISNSNYIARFHVDEILLKDSFVYLKWIGVTEAHRGKKYGDCFLQLLPALMKDFIGIENATVVLISSPTDDYDCSRREACKKLNAFYERNEYPILMNDVSIKKIKQICIQF